MNPTREVFRVREAKFQSRGVRLSGRLVMPQGLGIRILGPFYG